MSYDTISFTPMLSNNIFSNRFNQIDKIFSTLTGEKPLSELPDYDIIQCDDTKYLLIITVPGYHENELDVLIQNNQLKISGMRKKNNEKTKTIKYVHQGIKNNNFSMQFNLNHPIKIHQAKLNTGLLEISFEYDIPEAKKIKKINIQKV
ncbi:Hsp20 family protein [Buchnera aphidicola]|uniref:Heat-shock protein n=1 Tax=Buchnera aphidicola (Sarucallis kahawaluokalani) TaxID=1241878 RepID=A0A4D6YKH0_9GAMM|nr:Hsp20 family protein [Buchnera aphidicola]QCI26168.1 heat-shock protein [Buchnera aphidicola (Sarucallis kahawaluokalani)]